MGNIQKKKVIVLAQKKPTLNIAPLSSGFMLTALTGFLISVFYIYGISKPWGFTLGFFCVILFIAAMISMTYGPDDVDYLKHKPLHKK